MIYQLIFFLFCVLKHNNLPYGFAIPYWIRCKFEGNTQGNIKFQTSKSSNASEVYDPAIHRTHLSRYCNGNTYFFVLITSIPSLVCIQIRFT